MVRAIEKRDSKRAGAIMATHVSHGEARIVEAMRAAGYR
jgi:DNA-binding GntR family transcriptional regulator